MNSAFLQLAASMTAEQKLEMFNNIATVIQTMESNLSERETIVMMVNGSELKVRVDAAENIDGLIVTIRRTS